MELTYRQEGDYLLPNLLPPEAPKIGKYGILRKQYLKNERRPYYTGLLMSGELNEELERIDRESTEMVERLTNEMAKKAGVNESLKAKDQMEWVRMMNSSGLYGSSFQTYEPNVFAKNFTKLVNEICSLCPKTNRFCSPIF